MVGAQGKRPLEGIYWELREITGVIHLPKNPRAPSFLNFHPHHSIPPSLPPYLAHDILQRPPLLPLLRLHQVRVDRARFEGFVFLWGEGEILKSERGVGRVDPGDAEFALQVAHQADAGAWEGGREGGLSMAKGPMHA